MSIVHNLVHQLCRPESDCSHAIVQHWELHRMNPDLPYHNDGHCARVAVRAVTWAHDDGLDVDAKLALLAAGLWHDYGYVGAETDATNIPTAIRLWTRLSSFEPDFTARVAELIASTFYPYNDTPVPTIIRCLRDADLGEITEYGAMSHMRNLWTELRDYGKYAHDMDQFKVDQQLWWGSTIKNVSEGRRPLFSRYIAALYGRG